MPILIQMKYGIEAINGGGAHGESTLLYRRVPNCKHRRNSRVLSAVIKVLKLVGDTKGDSLREKTGYLNTLKLSPLKYGSITAVKLTYVHSVSGNGPSRRWRLVPLPLSRGHT